MSSPGEQIPQPKPFRPCPFIRSIRDALTDSKHSVDNVAATEPPLKSPGPFLVSPSQPAAPTAEDLPEDKKASATSSTSIIVQTKCPLCGTESTPNKSQSRDICKGKVTAIHMQQPEIKAIIDLTCQLIEVTVVRIDVVFVQSLSSTPSMPQSIQTAIDSCSTAKRIQTASIDCPTLSNKVPRSRTAYTVSVLEYNQHIKDIEKKTRNFTVERLNGVLVRANVCIPLALLNWSLPVIITNNRIKREEHKSYKYSIDPSTPNLYSLRPWQREAIEFYLLRGGKCILADPPEMGVAAQALLSAYQYKDSFPLFIIAHTNSISYWKEQVYLWYNTESARRSCMSQWLKEKDVHEAKTNSLKKVALKRSSGSEVKVMKRTRLRRVYELPCEYNINPDSASAIYALGYEDITSRGAFSQVYTHAVQTCFEGVTVCRRRMIIVLTAQNFLTLYKNGLIHTQSSTFILSDAQDYKDMSSKRTKELSLILSTCSRVITCISIACVSLLKVLHPQLIILGLSLGRMEFLARYCELKKRELRSGKVITTASGVSMQDELAYIFGICCLSRLSERYVGPKQRFILYLEGERDTRTDRSTDNDTLIEVRDSEVAVTLLADTLAGFYSLNSIQFIVIVHGKETGDLLADALRNNGLKVESISEKRNMNASLDSIHRLQSGELAALVCIDDAVSICFALSRTYVCFFVGLLWSSSEISMWESKLQTILSGNKRQCSIFITGPDDRSSRNSRDSSISSAKANFSPHLHPLDSSVRENFIVHLLHSWKVPRWDSYPHLSLSTLLGKRMETWFQG